MPTRYHISIRSGLLLLVLQSALLHVHAQDDRALADSLIQLLPHQAADSAKVYMYRDIAYYLQEPDPDSARHYARAGEKLARVLDMATGQVWNLNQQGIAWEGSGQMDSAIATYRRAHAIALQAGDEQITAQMLNTMGASFFFQGRLTEAIDMYDQALAIFEHIGDDGNMAWTLNNLGVIYRTRREHARAVAIYERSLALKIKAQDTLGLARTHHNLGLAWSYLGDHRKSLDHFNREYALLTTLGDVEELHGTLIGRGMALYKLGDVAQATDLFQKGLEGLPSRHVVKRATALLHLGLIDLENAQPTSGMRKLREAHTLIEHSGRNELLRSLEKELARACEITGDPACAALHWKAYAAISDSLASEQQQWAIEEMQAKYESREKENTIRLQELELEDERAQRKLYLITGLLAVLLLLASLGYVWNSLRVNRKLRAANALAQTALAERELLLKEMHHRVKNNLQMLNSLLSIQSRSLHDPGARDAMKQNRERVHAIGLIHQHLYTGDPFMRIDMGAYLRRLLDHLAQACELDEKKIALHAVTEPVQLDVDTATPIGLVVNELVTNAIKHAFPHGLGGSVTITLKNSDQDIVLQVQDDGTGSPADTGGHGFGHVLIDMLAQKLNARMEVDTSGGTMHTLHIPRNIHEHATVEHTGGGG